MTGHATRQAAPTEGRIDRACPIGAVGSVRARARVPREPDQLRWSRGTVVSYETIRLETDGAVARLTLDRPAALNAINRAMIREIHAALDRVEADEESASWWSTERAARSPPGSIAESAAEPIKGVAAWREVLRRDLHMTMRFWRLAKP